MPLDVSLLCDALDSPDVIRFSAPAFRVNVKPLSRESFASSREYSADPVLSLASGVGVVFPMRLPGNPSPMFAFPEGIRSFGSVLLLDVPAWSNVLLLSRASPLVGDVAALVSEPELPTTLLLVVGVLGDRKPDEGLLDGRILTVEHMSLRTSDS